MSPKPSSSGVNRRALLSALAVLPVSVAPSSICVRQPKVTGRHRQRIEPALGAS